MLSRPRPTAAFLLAAAAVLGLAFALRVSDLYSLPVFIDESNHLAWAQSFAAGESNYPLLMDGKLLLGLVLAPFGVTAGAQLWQARAALALLSLLSGAAAIRLGTALGSRRAGLLAGLLYALLPFAVFHDRQVLADPLMAHLGALALLETLLVARHGRGRALTIIALGGLLGAAVLAKLTGALYALPLGVAVLVLPRARRARWGLAGRYAGALVVAGVLVGGLLLGLRTRLGYDDQQLVSQRIGFVGCPALLCHGDLAEQAAQTGQALGLALNAAPIYFGWPVLLLATLALPLSMPGTRRPVAYLALAMVAMLAAFWLTARAAPPRYYTFLAVPVVVLAAHAAVALLQRGWAWQATGSGRRRLAVVLGAVMGTLLLLATLPNSVRLASAPAEAVLPEIDRQQYVTGPGAGTGLDQAARDYLVNGAAASVLANQLYTNQLAAYLDPTRTQLIDGLGHWQPALGQALQSGQPVYVVEEVAADAPPASEQLPGVQTEFLAEYPRRSGEHRVRVRRVVEVGAALRTQFFDELCLRPAAFATDYAALAQALATAGGEPDLLLAYPPNQAAALADQPMQPIGDTWPLDVAAVEAQLAEATNGASRVLVVFGQEAACDPAHAIERWLDGNLFRVGQQWFGALRLVEYAPGGGVSATIPAAASFGEAVTLEQIELIDSSAAAGGVVRLRVRWRVGAGPLPALTLFVHLFNDGGIAAQYDGPPAGAQEPTTSWISGESVVGQFALRLPPGIAPGTYQLRVGLYDPATLARAPVVLADGSRAEFFVGGTITVR